MKLNVTGAYIIVQSSVAYYFEGLGIKRKLAFINGADFSVCRQVASVYQEQPF